MGMKNWRSRLPWMIATARWLSFGVIVLFAAVRIRSVIGYWQTYAANLSPEVAHLSEFSSPWAPWFTYTLACVLCVAGALPMLRRPRDSAPVRALVEAAYVALAIYFLFILGEHIYYVFCPGHSGPNL
jgi:predicted signal transduction protein with EAL and GGDEF domain